MPLLLEHAKTISNNQLVQGIIEEIVDVDETFSLLPFVGVEGKAYVYNRENTLATTQFILPNMNVPESSSTFTEVTVTLRILIGDVDVDNFIQTTLSDTNNQRAVQIAHKAKAMARQFSQTFVTGDTSTVYNLSALGGPASATNVEFDGINKLTPSAMQVSNGNDGGALTFEKLDELIDTVKLGPNVFVMSRRTIRSYRKLLRALSSVAPEFVTVNGRQMLAYSGIPILLNDFLPNNQTVGSNSDCSSVYAIRFNEQDGLHAIFGGQNVGFRMVNIGQLENKDAERTRLVWYVALALKSTLSLGALRGVRAI